MPISPHSTVCGTPTKLWLVSIWTEKALGDSYVNRISKASLLCGRVSTPLLSSKCSFLWWYWRAQLDVQKNPASTEKMEMDKVLSCVKSVRQFHPMRKIQTPELLEPNQPCKTQSLHGWSLLHFAFCLCCDHERICGRKYKAKWLVSYNTEQLGRKNPFPLQFPWKNWEIISCLEVLSKDVCFK